MDVSSLPAVVLDRVRELETQDPQALVAVFDVYGYYLYASPNHREVLGYAPRQLLTMNLARLVVPDEHSNVFMLRTIITLYAKPITFSAHLLTRSGEPVKLSGTLYHLQHAGVRYFFTSVRPEPEA